MSAEHFQNLPTSVIEGPVPNQELKKSELMTKATSIAFDMYKAGLGSTPAYSELYYAIATPDNKLKEENDVDREKLVQILRDLGAIPPPLPELDEVDTSSDVTQVELASLYQVDKESVPDEIPDPEEEGGENSGEEVQTYVSKMQEREVAEAKRLSVQEASKQFLAAERKKLAEELRIERKVQRERLGVLKTSVEVAEATPFDSEADAEYGDIAETQGEEASRTAERLTKGELTEEGATEERTVLTELIATSTSVDALRKRLEDHYAKADIEAQKQFESVRKSVEQTLLRNNVFIVHAFLSGDSLRHNENSNIARRATLEDDIDNLLSLEPSISTSSVVPGTRQGLWNESIGVILGGGDIRGGAEKDQGTTTGGIKYRNGKKSTVEEIDMLVSNPQDRIYNELVVNNPKVFGFYSTVTVSESGKMMGFKPSTSNKDNIERKARFMKYIDLASEKGMPPLIMTPDRHVFEFVSVADDGEVIVGAEISPEQVARGNAGLSVDERKSLGEGVIKKNLFKSIQDQVEAKQIIAELGQQENVQIELTREEYLAYARDTDGQIREFPESLRGDNGFMIEVAQLNPRSAYENASESLKNDPEYIQQIYALRSGKTNEPFIYSYIPENLKKDESIALLAIEHDDFDSIDISLVDSPKIWAALTDKIIAKENPDKYFEREVGEGQVSRLHLFMRDGRMSIDVAEKMMTAEFIAKLNMTYPKYKFEVYPTNAGTCNILVTKLSD